MDNDVTVGQRVRVQSACYLTAFSVLEDDVCVLALQRSADAD